MRLKSGEISGRTANVKRNIIFDLLQFVVSHLLPFIVRTILIYRFGADYLGLNSLFTSILSVLSLMDLGFGTAVVYSLYKPIADGDTDLICAYLTHYRRIYRYVALAILLAGLTVMPFLKELVKDPSLPGGLNIYICYLIFLGNTVISYILYGYLTAIPTASQRKDILSRIDIVMSLLGCVVRIYILLSSENFYLYLLAMPALTVLHNLLIANTIKKQFPGYVCRGEISTERKNELKKNVSGILINRLTNVSRNSIDSLCISGFIGLSMTGIYSNYYFIMSSILSCGIMICRSMLASVGNSIAVEDVKKNYSDMRKFDFIFMSVVGWASVCMLCLYQPFIQVWVGEKMSLGVHVIVDFCLYYYILESGAIQWLYHQGAGLWYESRFIMLGEAVANVILNTLLCKIMGVFGIILATVISVFITNCILCPRLIFKEYFKNGKIHEYWVDHVSYAVTMLITAGVSWIICAGLLPMSLVEDREVGNCVLCLGGRLLVCTVLAFVIFWIIWHRSERYTKAVVWMKGLVKV